jgi:ATP-dependent Lon protease
MNFNIKNGLKMLLKKTYFALPLKGMVIFPKITTAILVGRKQSVNAVEKAYEKNENIFVVTQKNDRNDNIKQKDLYKVGILCNIIQKIVLPDGTLKILIQGISKHELIKFADQNDCFTAEIKTIKDLKPNGDKNEIDDLKKIVLNKFDDYLKANKRIPIEIIPSLAIVKTIDELLFYIITLLPLGVKEKQDVLECKTSMEKLKKVFELLELQIEFLKTENKISENVDKKFVDYQKKVYLNAKLQSIKKELGEDVKDDDSDIGELKKQIKSLNLPQDVREKCEKEVKHLENMFTQSAEYNVIKTYLDWIVSLPWNNKSQVTNDIEKAEKILERDHYGLDEVKKRIIEFLAVYKRTETLKGPIICLAGPPGVGKTSLAKSIAEAVNRNYIKVSLGGIRDEAEIRGHRKTYVGSMPGRIIQSIKKAKTSNPLMLLDEIDKVSSDYHGDPSSALLEVLDPEQNKNFNDHYLEVDYDLSDVMFLTTANNLSNIPIPLRDRMEVIKISGYTEEEKLQIAKKYLIPKQIAANGLKKEEFAIDDNSITKIIREYSFEAGVRNLERELAKLARKVVKELTINNKLKKITITLKNLKKYLGAEKFSYGHADKQDRVGVATGLAYTEYGGDLLSIEALKFSGNGKLATTGKLGDIMKESIQAAFSYVRSRITDFDITAKEFNKFDFHIHVPEGATPKDGPSAGVAICGALMSVITGLKIRKDIAMTGEITLVGNVLAIGGLKEKLLAALRGDIKTVIIPAENKRNLTELPKNVKKGLNIKLVKTIEEALQIMLIGYKEYPKKKK